MDHSASNAPGTEPIFRDLSKEEIIDSNNARIVAVADELRKGFRLVEQHPKSVTFYGSARFREGNRWYDLARTLGARLAKEGYTIVTGGGPGIMEAAHRGGLEAGGKTVGLNIHLPSEQHVNPYAKESVEFTYFFTRRVVLSFAAEAYIFFPGGFGTLDEFYELVTIVQTKRVNPVPIICVGGEFWKPFDELHRRILLEENQAINPEDITVYSISDDLDEIVKIVTNQPIRNGIDFNHPPEGHRH